MGQIIKDQKETNRKISYEDISSSIENSPEFSYLMEGDVVDSEQIIKNFLKELDKFLNEETLNENEIKLGHALYDLFNDYENIFIKFIIISTQKYGFIIFK